MRSSVIALLFTLSLASIANAGDPEKWWEYSTVYQIYPRSFQDTNNDGVGDLKGIEQRMSHLANFNGGSIWLSPIYQSPMVDFGYDISDFKAIDPIFGTFEDFTSMIEAAHQYGIRVVLDFIPNHSSDQHEWFHKSVMREDPYTDFYVWVDPKGYDNDGNPIPPSNWISRFRGSMWEFREERQQFYLHQYLIQQPDLNYRNPQLKELMFDAIKFWMDAGVDGFRLDAVTKLIEDDRWLDEPSANNPDVTDPGDWLYYNHMYTNNMPETRDILKEFYDLVKTYEVESRSEERVMMLEAWLDIDSTMMYYECGDFPFNFGFVNLDERPSADEIKEIINLWLDNLPEGKTPNWVLGNHDRKRLGTRLGHDFIDLANMITMTLPGIAVTYYGEEIGMTDANITYEDTVDPWGCNCGPDKYKECSRDPSRTPMQWSGGKNAGFSSGDSTWLPINENYHEVNLEIEANKTSGVWYNVKKLLELRTTSFISEELKHGYTEIITLDNVLFIKRFDPGRITVISMANLNNIETSLDLQSIFGEIFDFILVFMSTTQDHDEGGFYDATSFTLSPNEGVVFEFVELK